MNRNPNNQSSGTGPGMGSAQGNNNSRHTHPPHLPYIPRPGQIITPPDITPESYHHESEADLDGIQGSSIMFGRKETYQIDDNGNAHKICQRPSYILSGKRVSRIEDIGGLCRYCQDSATQAYQDGKLSFEQMQLRSFFDANSGCQCGQCGQYFCRCHCKSAETPEGPKNLCVECNEQIKKQQFRNKIIRLLAAPFIALLSLFLDSTEDEQA